MENEKSKLQIQPYIALRVYRFRPKGYRAGIVGGVLSEPESIISREFTVERCRYGNTYISLDGRKSYGYVSPLLAGTVMFEVARKTLECILEKIKTENPDFAIEPIQLEIGKTNGNSIIRYLNKSNRR